jgi:putative ABC transport system permease protein
MFWRFVFSAVKLRRRRLTLAFTAMAVAGALATALFSVYSDVEKKLSQQFQAYGANVVIAPEAGALTVPLASADAVRRLGGKAQPILLYASELDGHAVAIAGVDPSSLSQFWHVDGKRGACMAGTSLGLKVGETVHLKNYSCVVDGVVSTGGAEDGQIILPFATVEKLSGLVNRASGVQVRIAPEKVQELSKEVPDADVRLVRAVAGTEANVVLKVRVALFLLMAVILGIVTISVSSNFGELVMERTKEIGILKAIGAGEKRIIGLFIAEALILALAATVTGYFFGLLLAGWIDESVFESTFAVHISPTVLLLSAVVTFAVALAATGVATGRIWRIQPAIILRGE